MRQLRPLKMIRLLAHHSIAREIIRTILIALRIMEGVFMVDEIRNPFFENNSDRKRSFERMNEFDL